MAWYEIIYFITKAKMRVDDEMFSFEPGDMVFLNPGDKHEFVAEDDDIRLIAVKLPNIVDDKVEC